MPRSTGTPGSDPQRSASALAVPLTHCLRRIRSWRSPPNWLPVHWREEIEAHAVAAACTAQSLYDSTSNIPFDAFVYQRVMARSLTRYRQEWAYAWRCTADPGTSGYPFPPEPAAPVAPDHFDLDAAVASLTDAERWLLEQIFWCGNTEATVAARLGLSQRAVSKRKQAVLRLLRERLEDR